MSVSHPLSAEPATTRRRNPPTPSSRPTSNYFSLKHESDARTRHAPSALVVTPPADSGIRVEREPGQNETPSTAHPTDIGIATPMPRTPIFSVTDGDEDPASQIVLATRWHTLSDEDIQANVASLSSVQSPSDESSHPYHDTIRILSAACERLVRQAAALERAHKSLKQQEARRKKAAERAVKDLKPGQKETGQQLLCAIYALEPTEPIHNVSTTLNSSKSPNTLPISISEAMQDVWTPPARDGPILQPAQPLDIPPTPTPDAMSIVSDSRSRASSFTPGSSAASQSIRSEKTSASKSFLGGWFGRSVSRAEEHDDQDTDADVISVASGNVSITAPGNSTAKIMSGVLRKGRNVFGAFGITPTPPSSIPTPPRPEPPQEQLEDHQDTDARSLAAFSYTGSPISKIGSLPFQAPLMSPVLPAVTTFSTKAQSITALSIDSGESPAPESPTPPHPAEYLKQHGHPAHLRAIVLATRVMTTDPKSILADRGADTSKLIARGAVALVEAARQRGTVAYEPGSRPGELRRSKSKSISKSRSASVPRTGEAKDDDDEEPKRAVGVIGKAQGASASLGRALAEQNQLRDKAEAKGKGTAGTTGNLGSKFRNLAPMAVAALGSPLLSTFPKSSNTPTRPAPTSTSPAQANPNNNPIAGPATTAVGPGGTIKKPPGRGTVELSSIVPVQMQPPTQFLSRAYTSSRLTNPSFRPQLASRFTLDPDSGENQEGKKLGMTDRYGFIYGVNAYDVRLLQRAREVSNTAPACLTGMKVQERVLDDDDEPGMQSPEKILESFEADTSMVTDADVSMATDLDTSMTASEILEVAKTGKSRPGSSKRTPTINTLPKAAPTTANTTPATATTSPPSSSTVRKLLDQLTALHDTQQTAQKAEWDAFLKRRRQGGGGTLLGFMGGADAGEGSDEEREWGLGMLGVSRMDKANAKEFSKLVRGGVPLVYRDKVWSECSGATEMREPGVFQELLSKHEGVQSPTLKEIEKDVVRTMPLNVFFGGDGMGVSKLRRVLQAYSWRNPELGYCQGMNLIASTLLLVFSEEEDAFWVLTCIIEKFLPSEFFSGSLVESRACPLVLLDYVELHHPKVYAHLLDIGVDLPAICFSWFLSLYTDCLPVETLFRVWDLVFAEGLDALFRIGLAIIRINEPELLACDSAPTLYQYLEGMTARMWQADKLMKVSQYGAHTRSPSAMFN
ncbi:hypothetical protein FRC12_004649 [Ceratobasidium sp. 428]|nr:hypothetical protein FRC12_004649 [Ceratobasidium sp. 428]